MGYYRIIEGLRYDRQLLELAEERIQGRGDGRISEADAQALLVEAQDGRGITLVEQRTLRYIMEHFILTGNAIETLRKGLGLQPPPEEVAGLAQRIIVADFGLPGLTWQIDQTDVQQQSNFPNTAINFETALRESLRAFLEDGRDVESPWSLVSMVEDLQPQFFPSDEAYETAVTERVMFYMNEEGKLRLLPYDEEINFDKIDYNPPEDGESLLENWVFSLYLPKLSDHLYWAIVDREGIKETYTYGFN